MLLHRLDEVATAGRMKATLLADQRTQKDFQRCEFFLGHLGCSLITLEQIQRGEFLSALPEGFQRSEFLLEKPKYRPKI